MNPGAAAANALWALSCLPEAAAFRRAAADPARAQGLVLRSLLRRNADTEFGRRHDFASIRSAAQYRERVPLATYDDVRGAVERIARGEAAVLTRDRVRLLEPTSGSSSAPKLIPYTASLQAEFRRAIAAWLADLFVRRPRVLAGRAYWSVSPVARAPERTQGGIPVGFEDDGEYLGGLGRRLAAAAWAVPSDVRHVADLDAFRYVTLLLLLRCPDLRLASVWSPTFLSLLVARLPAWGDRLTRDVARGTCSPPGDIPEGLRRRLSGTPDPARAARVAAAFGTGGEGALHARLWPRLSVLSCWADGSSSGPARGLARLFPQARVQPKGLVATEGIVSIPFAGAEGAVLALRSHFLEFLPEGGGDARLAHELEPGRTYAVVLTTGGGLYRYRLGDRVEVTGRYRACPRVRLLGREGGGSDWFGEKLEEAHVARALDAALDRRGLSAAFALLACETGESGGAYTLFAELPGASDEEFTAVAEDLDRALGSNYHYRYCRDLGQLGPVRAFRVTGGGAEAHLAARRRAGQRLGDVKPAVLDRGDGWSRVFAGRFVTPKGTP